MELVKKATMYVSNITLFMLLFYSALRATIIPEILGFGDRTFFYIIPILGVCFLVNFFVIYREEKKQFIKDNIVAIIYFSIRCISIVIIGINALNDGEMISIGSIVYEITFVLLINRWSVGQVDTISVMLKMFIGFTIIINVASFVIYCLRNNLDDWGISLAQYHVDWQYMELHPWAALFMNPNNAGIMTAFSILVLLCLARKTKIWVVFTVSYIIFNLFMLYQYGCRSAELGIIIVMILFLIVKFTPLKRKALMQIVLCVFIAGNIIMLAYVSQNTIKDGNMASKMNILSTGRYAIWVNAYNTMDEKRSFILGEGSNEQELINRNNYLKERWVNSGQNESTYVPTKLGIHNAYFGIFFNSGVICFILFVIWFWQKIRYMPFAEKGNWYLIVIFALVENNFESLLIMNKSYLCFILMMIMVMSDNEQRKLGEKDECQGINNNTSI